MDSRNGARQVVVSGSVNHTIPGAYPISYSASDLSGNVSSVIRTVQVIDQTPPLLTLSGASSMQITLGSVFQDPGAFATDGWEGPLPFRVSGAVDTSSTGTYLITYNAVDSAGNAAPEAVRTVFGVGSNCSSCAKRWSAWPGVVLTAATTVTGRRVTASNPARAKEACFMSGF